MKPMPLRRDAFLRWLMKMPENMDVGQARSICRCPVARFLRGSRGVQIDPQFTFIHSSEWWFYHGDKQVMPRWARQVVLASDNLPDNGRTDDITAAVLRYRLWEMFGWPTLKVASRP